jgi:hypothetical protein
MLQAERSRVRVPMRWTFFNLPNLSSPGFVSATNRNEYKESSWGGKGRPARKADSLTDICEPIVWRKCGSLGVSQPYGPSRPVAGIAFNFTGCYVVWTRHFVFEVGHFQCRCKRGGEGRGGIRTGILSVGCLHCDEKI